jgi:hypothetical protein
MAWTTPATAVSGQTALTASFWNTQVRDNQNFLYTPPMCMVRRTTNLTSYTSNTAITWESSAYDTDTMWSSGTNVVIKTAGVYLVSFYSSSQGSATITRISPRINKNGTLIVPSDDPNVITGTNADSVLTITTKCAVNDTIAGTVLFAGGSSYIINGAASEGATQTRLSVTWLGSG